MLKIREELLSDKNRRIGYGKEADIFVWENHIWKIFPLGTKKEIIQRNVDFLQKYWQTGHVPKYTLKTYPKLCFVFGPNQRLGTPFVSKVPPNRRFRYKQIHSVEFGLIKMEFVDGVTLSEFVKTEQAKDWSVRNHLLYLLWIARLKLPHDIEFTDLKNSDNIMLKLDGKGLPVHVMFLEGGTEIYGTNNALCLFLEMVTDLIKARQSPFYQARHATMMQYLQ